MPAQKNTTLRIVVPIIVIAIAIMIVAAFAINASSARKSASKATATPPAATTDGATQGGASQAGDSPTEPPPAGTAEDGADVPPSIGAAEEPSIDPAVKAASRAEGWHARVFETPADEAVIVGAAINVRLEKRGAAADGSGPESWTLEWRGLDRQPHSEILGAVDAVSASAAERARREKESRLNNEHGYRLEARLTAVGAGIEEVRSSEYFKTIRHREHYLIQHRLDSSDGSMAAIPLSITGVVINDQWVPLFNAAQPPGAEGASGVVNRLWRVTGATAGAAAFEAVIEDASGSEAVRLGRSYTLAPNSSDLLVGLTIENLTATPMEIRVVMVGPVELPLDTGGYRIALERVRFGGLLSVKRDPSRQIVEGDRKLMGRATALKWAGKPGSILWPNEDLYQDMGELAWVAQTNRYFAFAVHSTPAEGQEKSLWAARSVYPQGLYGFDSRGNAALEDLHLEMHSRPIAVAPGASQRLDMGVYAGPISQKLLDAKADPLFGRISLDDLVIFQLSLGPCALCTFQWLTHLLFLFLSLLHKYVVFDWALAIMVLVVIVRTILHPITKKSQISMMRFGKQMQALAPKQKAIQEKYKDDRVKLQQEMARLMKEEGVNYANMLGCLPMFLQTPVWIALYAMLYLAFDLRHEPAFFGIIQKIAPNWSFLGDLSVGDHFIDFGRNLITLPLMGDITGINILPFLLGVVFYIQQKYLTPPPTTQLTPEQQSQQKMMKVMMIVMFPVFMYNAPSALALYFITNSTLGILESRYIRSHVDQDALVPEKPRHAGLGRKKVSNKAKSPFKRGEEPRKRFKDRG